ncbi:hypothetical protein GCM10010411_61700 [Actinomadura fulvescens]|uniref:Uncharacterized protein n=1 Tax=Actinomadura fulvescens TaxID=46160 RepID=A0ABP6CEX5_9ACTN
MLVSGRPVHPQGLRNAEDGGTEAAGRGAREIRRLWTRRRSIGLGTVSAGTRQSGGKAFGAFGHD